MKWICWLTVYSYIYSPMNYFSQIFQKYEIAASETLEKARTNWKCEETEGMPAKVIEFRQKDGPKWEKKRALSLSLSRERE